MLGTTSMLLHKGIQQRDSTRAKDRSLTDCCSYILGHYIYTYQGSINFPSLISHPNTGFIVSLFKLELAGSRSSP